LPRQTEEEQAATLALCDPLLPQWRRVFVYSNPTPPPTTTPTPTPYPYPSAYAYPYPYAYP
jgi:hypothetical protein